MTTQTNPDGDRTPMAPVSGGVAGGVLGVAGGVDRGVWLSRLRECADGAATLVAARDTALSGEDGVLGSAGSVDLAEVLRLVDGLIAAATAVKLTALRALDASLVWQRAGYRRMEDWRAATSKQGKSAAYRDIRTARDLGELTQVDEALGEGRITPEAAGEISRFRHSGDTGLRDEALKTGTEERLVRLAERGNRDSLARSVKAIGHLIDSSAVSREFEQVHAARFLRLTKRSGGVAGEFLLDPVAGHELKLALEAHAQRPAKDDARTCEQRAADALVELAKTGLDSGVCKNGALVRPHVSIILREETLAAALAHLNNHTPDSEPDTGREAGHAARDADRDADGDAGMEAGSDADAEASTETDDEMPEPAPEETDPGDADGDQCQAGIEPVLASDWRERRDRDLDQKRRAQERERLVEAVKNAPYPTGEQLTSNKLLAGALEHVPAAELDDGTPLPPHLVAAVLCDCLIGRIVINAEGQPTDIGRERRTAIADLRRAILVRDRTCRYPGCGMAGRWCDYHHIASWAAGGNTSIANGLMLCRFHHQTVVHGHGVQISPVSGGFEFRRRSGELIGTTFHQTLPRQVLDDLTG